MSSIRSLRRDARAIFDAGVAAADPVQAVRRELSEMELRGRWWLIAFGKAALAMTGAALKELEAKGAEIAGGVVVTNEENLAALEEESPLAEVKDLELRGGGHPLPDAQSERSAQVVERLLGETREGEGVLMLISGGGSALLAAPAAGLTLQDKIVTTRQLLDRGADIHQLNAVRKHLSRLKGGQLAALAHPARVEALVLSDVVGDDLSTVASGPTVGDQSSYAEALEVLEAVLGLDNVLPGVRRHLERGVQGAIPETPCPGDPVLASARTHLIGGNGLAVGAMVERARALGYFVEEAGRSIEGEAREVAADFVRRLAVSVGPGSERFALVGGGETTVTVTGDGKGGRNQELALAFALAEEGEAQSARASWVFLSAGTDGRDGPTDAAGGMVDPGTLPRIRNAGLDPAVLLDRNDSHRALDASGDLLITGPTGTNVADLMLWLAGS